MARPPDRLRGGPPGELVRQRAYVGPPDRPIQGAIRAIDVGRAGSAVGVPDGARRLAFVVLAPALAGAAAFALLQAGNTDEEAAREAG